MTINSLLNPTMYADPDERDFLQDLTDEAIQICGVDMKYLKAELVNRDYLFGESTMQAFTDAITIEMEIKEIVNFGGDGDLFSKFGIEHSDQATFAVSVSRFKDEGAAVDLKKPRIGDVIHMPTNNSIWRIKNVKEDEYFRRLGKTYTWRLDCSLMTDSHQEFDDADLSAMDALDFDTDAGLALTTIGINSMGFADESDMMAQEAQATVSYDPQDPFGGL